MNEYYIHDVFDINIFKDFIETLNTKKIEINSDNYLDYYKLSTKYEYHELTKSIQDFMSNRPDLKIIFDQLSSKTTNSTDNQHEIVIDQAKEKLISQNLDFCLEHGNLSNLPLQTINRIINSPDRILTNHHLLYKFVIDKISQIRSKKQQKNESEETEGNIQLMISSLDYNEMSTDEIENLIENMKSASYFSPRHSKELIQTLLMTIKKNDERMNKIEKELFDCKINDENRFNKIEKEMSENKSNDQERMNKIEKELSQQKIDDDNRLNKIERELNENKIDDDKMRNENIELKKKIENLEIQIQNLQKMISEYQQKQGKEEAKILGIEQQQELYKKEMNQQYEKQKIEIESIQNIIKNIQDKVNKQSSTKQKKMKETPTQEIKQPTKNIKQSNIKEFKQQDPKKFNGIMKYLGDKNGGKVHEAIEITSNNIKNTQEIVNYNKEYSGCSSSQGNTFFLFDFKEQSIKLTNYSILSFNNNRGDGQMKNWALEGSNNKIQWNEIDKRENDPTLNACHFVGTFKIQNENNDFYRFIRIRQTGESWSYDKKDFGCNLIEFYGFLQES